MKADQTKKRKQVLHRVGTAHRNRVDMKIEEVKQYVIDNLQVGGKLAAPYDAYNMDNDRMKIFTERTVVGIYPNFILTVDDFGKRETFQYVEAFELMNRRE